LIRFCEDLFSRSLLVFAIHKVLLHPRRLLREKISAAKLQALQKGKFSAQDKEKSRGKADACRGFLTQYCLKRVFLKRVHPLWSAASGGLLFLHSFRLRGQTSHWRKPYFFAGGIHHEQYAQ